MLSAGRYLRPVNRKALRHRRVAGWTTLGLHPAEERAIKTYLEAGSMSMLFPAAYQPGKPDEMFLEPGEHLID